MDIEEATASQVVSATPELDADLPVKGIPRLVIQKLVLENFKSYAGVKEIGPFHKNFTAIVGPNGSGKSNVIDSLLFVFGKRASKLRLKRVSELIHNSAKVAPCQFARVSVHFEDIIDGENDTFSVVPGSQIVISRVAYQNNTSKYFINNKSSNASEVTTLLKQRGIDLDNNRFLILQGEVEQISLMKAKRTGENDEGLLEYLEDIIGSAKYVPMIESKEVEVEKLNDSRGEVLNRVKMVEKERNTLEAGKKEADLYLSKERELAREQALLYQCYLYESGLEEKELRAANGESLARLTQLRGELEENSAKIKTMEQEYKRVCEEYDLICKELQKCKEEYDSFERKDIQFRENRKAQKANLQRLKGKLSMNESSKKEKEESIATMESNLERLEREVVTARAKKEELEEELTRVLSRFKEEINQLKAKRSEIDNSLQPLRERFAVQDSSLKEKQSELDTIIARRSRLEAECNTIRRVLDDQTDRLNKALLDLEQKRVALANASAELEEMKEQKERTKMELDSIETERKRKRATLAEKKSVFTEQQNRSGVLATLMRAAQPRTSFNLLSVCSHAIDGELEHAGVCGRLGDLGEIDSYYDVAASTASSALDYIVVETGEGAQKCVEYLKKYNAGRSRFLILEEMQKYVNQMNAPFTCPPNSHRLFDLIHIFDDKYRPAFYFAFSDTLVTTSLDIASKIAYSKHEVLHRVVTTTGQIIEKTGTMSGGGHSNRHGLLRLKDKSGKSSRSSMGEEMTQATMDELEKAVKVLNDRYESTRKELTVLQDKVRTTEASIPNLQLEIEKLEIDIASLRSSVEKKAAELQTASNDLRQTDNDQERRTKLEEEIRYIEMKLKGIQSEMKSYEDRIKAVDKEIDQVGGETIQKRRREVKSAKDRHATMQKEISSTKVKLRSAQKSIKQLEEENVRLSKDIQDADQSIQTLTNQMKLNEEEAEKSIIVYKQAQTSQEAKEAEKSQVEKAFEEAKGMNSQIEKSLAELEEKSTGLAKQLEELENQRDIWLKKINQLRRKTWENTRELDGDEEGDDDKEEEEEGRRRTKSSTPSSTGNEHTDGEQGDMEIEDKNESTTDMEVEGRIEESPLTHHPTNDPGYRIIPDVPEDRLATVDKARVERNIIRLEAEKDNLKKNVNLGAIAEFRAKDREYRLREKELDEVTAKRDTVRKEFDDLRKKRLTEFMDGFNIITLKLKEMYQMITLGGDAELELVDSLDPFSEGIVFSVRPPKKSWKNISNLSGGEKTLSSLALVFALHHYKPTPLYVMDEIDAALDFRNVSIVAHYIKERTKNAQFVVISLRNNMFELADRLVGIYKTDDCTDSVSINPAELCSSPH